MDLIQLKQRLIKELTKAKRGDYKERLKSRIKLVDWFIVDWTGKIPDETNPTTSILEKNLSPRGTETKNVGKDTISTLNTP